MAGEKEEEKPIPKLLKSLFNWKRSKKERELEDIKHEIEKAKLEKELRQIKGE